MAWFRRSEGTLHPEKTQERRSRAARFPFQFPFPEYFQCLRRTGGGQGDHREALTAQEEQKKKDDGAKDLGSEDKPFDEEGNRDVESIVIGKTPDIFGDKIYEKLADDVEKPLQDVAQHTPATENAVEEITRKIDTATDAVADTLISDLVPQVSATYGVTKARQKRMENDIRSDVKGKVEGEEGSVHPRGESCQT